MKVMKKTGEDGHIKLDVTASTQEVSQAINQASEVFCTQMGIQPVPGKTPAQVVSERLGIKDLDSAIAPQAAELLVPHALNKHNIIPAFTPTPHADMPIRRGRAFQFTLDVIPKPSYELTDYGPVKFRAQEFKSDEEEVDQAINEMAREYTSFVPTDPHPIHKGDSCLLKMRTTKNGEELSGLTTDKRYYTLGEDLMPVGFDEGIDGMEVGETRTFTFEGPGLDAEMNEVMEEYEATITLLEVEKEVVPVIDDAWVEKNMPMYNTLEGLRAGISKKNDADRRMYYEDYKRNLAASELSRRFEGSIPDEIYEGTMHEEQRKLRKQVAASGTTWEKFCEEQGGEQQVGMMLMVSMRQQLVQGYALDAYYRHHKLQYTPADLDETCFQLNPRDPKRMRQQMERNGLGFALKEAAERLRACKHLVEHADITYTEATDQQMPMFVDTSHM